jgi:hypothetical protein
MQELFRMVEILDSILAAEDHAKETRNQLDIILKEIHVLESEIYNNYLLEQELQDEIIY